MTTTKNKVKQISKITLATTLVASSIPFAAPLVDAKSFSDVKPENVHAADISELANRGIIDGTPDGTYKPDDFITRAQAAKIIANILKLDLENVANPDFFDVPDTNHYYAYIAALSEADIIHGYEGKYNPNSIVTRGQMAKIIARAFNLDPNEDNAFKDVPKNHEFAGYINSLAKLGITNGTLKNTYEMDNFVTRAQMASFVVRAEKATSTQPLNGTIEKISSDSITVNGITYYTTENTRFLTAEDNRESIQNAEIAFVVSNNKVQTVDKLVLSNGENFNGYGNTINEIEIVNSIAAISNFETSKLTYTVPVNGAIIDQVNAQEVLILSSTNSVASLGNHIAIQNNAELLISNSIINRLTLGLKALALNNQFSKINLIDASKVSTLNIEGSYNEIILSNNMLLSGKAVVDTFTLPFELANGITISPDIEARNFNLNNQIHSWKDAIKLSGIQIKGSNQGSSNGTPSVPTPNPGGSVPPATEENNKQNLVNNINQLLTETSLAIDSKNSTLSKSLLDQINVLLTSELNPQFENQVNVLTEKYEALLKISDNIQLSSEDLTISENGLLVIGEAEYQLTEDQQALFRSDSIRVDTINFQLVNNEIVAINTLEVTTTSQSFSGASIPKTEKLVVYGDVASIQNVDTNELIISSTNPTVTINNGTSINNVTSNTGLILAGNISRISNIIATEVMIQTVATEVNVSNVTGNVTIEDPTSAQIVSARLLSNQIAALNIRTFVAVQDTTAFKITFTGDYDNKSLTINRKDTIVDIQSNKPFTQLNIQADNFTLTSGFNLAKISANQNVSYLQLNGDIAVLDLSVDTRKVVISGSGSNKINILNINSTQATPESDGLIELLNLDLSQSTFLLSDPHNTSQSITAGGTNPNPIFYIKPAAATFVPKLVFSTFGRYSVTDTTATNIKITQLPGHVQSNQYLTTLHTDAVSYTAGDKFTIYHDTENIIVYQLDASDNILSYGLPDMPSIPKTYLYSRDYGNGDYIFVARAKDTDSVADILNYFILFDNGEIKFSDLSLNGRTWLDSKVYNLHAVTINTGYSQNYLENDLYLTGDVLFKSNNFADDSIVYVNSMKALAKFITETPNASSELMKPFLRHVAANENSQFDSMLLDKYVAKLNSNPGSYNSVTALKTLLEDVKKDNPYTTDVILTNSNLYLTGEISTDFTYKAEGIISNQVTGGKLLFTPLKVGKTTLRVTDGTNATLLNVEVKEENGVLKTTYKIVEEKITQGTLLEGSDKFRFVDDLLLPTSLENSVAILQKDTSESDLVGNLRYITSDYDATSEGFKTSDEVALTPKEYSFTELGFNDSIIAPAENDTFGTVIDQANKKITFYAKREGTINTSITDGINKTAIQINSANHVVTDTIAKSKELSVKNIHGLSKNFTIDYSSTLQNVHVFKVEDGDDVKIRFFAGAEESGYVTFTDTVSGKKTLVNIEAAGTPIVIPDPVILKQTLDGTTGSITSMSPSESPVVRYDGLTLYALRIGTALIKLSDGKQYQIEVAPGSTNSAFLDMKVANVTTAELTASALQMTNIDTATFTTGTGTIEKANGNLYITVDSEDAELKVQSNTDPIEYTTVYITKDANGEYSIDTDYKDIEAADLGFTKATSILTDASTSSRAVILDEGNVRVYGATDGTRIIQVSDGTNITAMNTIVKRTDGRYKISPTAVTHALPTGLKVDTHATLPNQIHTNADGTIIYATGIGLQDGAARVQVPLEGGSNYVIDLATDAAKKILSFEDNGEIIYNESFIASKLGLDTITSASVTSLTDGKTVATSSVANNTVTIITIEDGLARIQVTGTKGDSTTAITNVYLTKADNGAPVFTIEKLADTDTITFSEYGIGTVTSTSLLPTNIVREVRTATTATFYALEEGKTAYTVNDDTNKAIINITVSKAGEKDKFVISQEIAQYKFENGATGQIISGNSVRLSLDKTAAYAIAGSGTTRVQLSDGSIIDLTPSESGGHYSVAKADVTNTTVLKATDLDLGTNVTFTNVIGSNPAVFETALLNGQVIIYGKADGTTSLTLTTSSGETLLANVTVDASGKIVKAADNENEIDKTKTYIVKNTHPTATSIEFLHNEDKAHARIGTDGKTLYAITPGVVELLVTEPTGKSIQRVEITKDATEAYTMSAFTPISSTVLSTETLGLGTNVASSIQFSKEDVVVTGKIGTDIYAYSKLDNAVTGATEMTVTATASNLSTVVRLTATGDQLTHTIFEQTGLFDSPKPTTVQFDNDRKIARYDQETDTTYSLVEGFTHALVNTDMLYTIEVKRNSNNELITVPTLLSISAPVDSDTGTKVEISKVTGTIPTSDDVVRLDTDNDIIYAVGIGSTQVKVGDEVWTIIIEQASNGRVTMTKEVTTSQTILAADAGFTTIDNYNVILGSSAIRINRNEAKTELLIYSNGAQTAQTARINLTSGSDEALVNVVINADGKISSANVVKATAITTNIESSTAVKDAITRGTWKNKEINIYGLSVGTTALLFSEGIVNVTVSEDTNKVLSTTANIVSKTIEGTITTIANNNVVNVVNPSGTETVSTIYAKSEGTAFLTVGNKLYVVNVTKSGNHYTMQVSDPYAYTELDIKDGTVAQETILNGINTVIDTKNTAEKTDDKLIIYTNGTAQDKGVSDIIISSAGDKTLYHVTATTDLTNAPVKSNAVKADLSSIATSGATISNNAQNVVRQELDDLYLLKEGSFTLESTYLMNGNVSRNSEGYLTVSAENASIELTEEFPTTKVIVKDENDVEEEKLVPLTLENFEGSGKTVTAKKNNVSDVFLTANYRAKATAKLENNEYTINLDERKMVAFDLSKYGLTKNVTYTSSQETSALVETYNDSKVVIYAGDTSGTSTIIATDGTKQVKFTAHLAANGTFTVTPAVADEAIKFNDLNMTVANSDDITVESNDGTVASTILSTTGISFAAKKAGTTSFIVKQKESSIDISKALVNVKVESIDNVLVVTKVDMIKLTGDFSQELYKTQDFNGRIETNTFYPTTVGTALYKNSEDKATRVVVSLDANNLYSVSSVTASYKAFTSTELGFGTTTIQSAIPSNATVNKYIRDTNLYLFAANEGSSDVVVTDGTNKAISVVNNGETLTATLAVKALDAADQTVTTWSDNGIVQIRDNKIYALTTGKALLNGTLTEDSTIKVFMNVNVTRKSNQEFDIDYKVVKNADYSTVQVLTGTSVIVHDNILYAQALGSSTVVLDGTVQTITVEMLADGSYDMKFQPALEQKTITPAMLGVTTINKNTLYALTGSNVVDVKTVGDDLIIIAKTPGEAEVKISTGEVVETWMHILVTQDGDTLKIQETVAQKNDKEYVANVNTDNDIVRIAGNTLYAKATGETLVTVGDALYKVVVSKQTNKFNISATPIEVDLKFTPTDSIDATNSTFINLVGSKLIAKAPTIDAQDSTKTVPYEVTLDTHTFRYEVKFDGTMTLTEIFADDIILSDYLDAITEVSANKLLNITVNDGKTGIKATPTDNATDGTTYFTVSSGSADTNNKITIQVKAVITGTKVELSVVQTAVTTLPLGFYPTTVETPDGLKKMNGTDSSTTKNLGTANGLVKIVNDKVVFYPGSEGTSHFMIKGGGNTTAIYEMKVIEDLSYEIKPFTETIRFSELASSPTILTNTGNATAKLEDTGFVITLNDTNESIFVIRGEGGVYKTIKVQATADGSIYKVSNRTILDATEDIGSLLTGQISNVNGVLKSTYDSENNKTVLYGTQAGTGTYTWNDKLYNVSIAANSYAVTTPTLVTAAPLDTTATATYLKNDQVVTFDGSQFVAIAAGTGIYKTDTGYVEITVALNADQQYEITSQRKLTPDTMFSDATNVEVVYGGDKVFVDDTTLYGDATADIVVRVTKDGKSTLYKGKLSNLVIEETDLLTALGWSLAPSDSKINETSKLVRIVDGKLQANGEMTGEESITFVSANGMKQTLVYKIDPVNYSVSIVPGNNIITFSEVTPTTGTSYEFTFNVNVNSGITFTVPESGSTIASTSVHLTKKNKIMMTFNNEFSGKYEENFNLLIPELGNKTVTATITVEYINGAWKPAKVTVPSNEEEPAKKANEKIIFHNNSY